jgi:galactokinase/mevalonate kinase-like predicted kinase
MAVLLNGQPPIQVFLRPVAELVISLKSIDLGVSQVLRTHDELGTFRDPRSGFSLPKAALAMAGFHPDFSAGRERSLRGQLTRLGSGLEISLLSAVPKGSGLGTSSILAATILGALNRACDLGWDLVGLYSRTLAVEQLLTTGGGWQDQAGALFGGIKLIETGPGTSQMPTIRYLPSQLFDPPHANRSLLLYYTGITRLAKGILKEIVRNMFLARFGTLQTLAAIRSNAFALAEAIQRNDREAVGRGIARSWVLNKQLDLGTTTPAIDALLRRCGPDLLGAKLLGAGGGGYLLLCAANPDSGQRIRELLERKPLNARARFIDFEVAPKGLEVTVS